MDWEKLKQIIYLLDDDDTEMANAIMHQLISEGEAVYEKLEEVNLSWDISELVEDRIETVLHKIRFQQLGQRLLDWMHDDTDNLLNGLILVASFQYQHIDNAWIEQRINTIANNIEFELSITQPSADKIDTFNRIFFDTYQFQIIENKEVSPQYYSINHVLSHRKGEPVIIALLYQVIAQKLLLPVSGVILPHHYILAFKKPGVLVRQNPGNNIRFYINPEKKGVIFSSEEIKEYLTEYDLPYKKEFFHPCGNVKAIKNLLERLQEIYYQNKENEKSDELGELAALLKDREEWF